MTFHFRPLASNILLVVVSAALCTSACASRRGGGRTTVDSGTPTDLGVGVDAPMVLLDGGRADFGGVDLGPGRDLGVIVSCEGFIETSGSCSSPADGDIGLSTAGILLVYNSGSWLGICDDGFSSNGANVACRQLGHTSAVTFTTATGTSDTFWLDDVACIGDELTLASCPNSGWGVENCSASESILLTCL